MRSSVFYVTSCQVDKLLDGIRPDRELSRRDRRIDVCILDNQSGKRKSHCIFRLRHFLCGVRK
jgi:hypothetical protein